MTAESREAVTSPQSEPTEAPPKHYEITVEVASGIRAFLDGINQLTVTSGVELDPGYGGISVDGRIIGCLRCDWPSGRFVVDVRNR